MTENTNDIISSATETKDTQTVRKSFWGQEKAGLLEEWRGYRQILSKKRDSFFVWMAGHGSLRRYKKRIMKGKIDLSVQNRDGETLGYLALRAAAGKRKLNNIRFLGEMNVDLAEGLPFVIRHTEILSDYLCFIDRDNIHVNDDAALRAATFPIRPEAVQLILHEDMRPQSWNESVVEGAYKALSEHYNELIADEKKDPIDERWTEMALLSVVKMLNDSSNPHKMVVGLEKKTFNADAVRDEICPHRSKPNVVCCPHCPMTCDKK